MPACKAAYGYRYRRDAEITSGRVYIKKAWRELKALAERNLDEATFEERREVISKLDIKIYPSEDLKTMRIKCGVNLTCGDIDNGNGASYCGKIIFGPVYLQNNRRRTKLCNQVIAMSSLLALDQPASVLL